MAFENSFDITKFIVEAANEDIKTEAAYFRTSPNLCKLPFGFYFVRNSRGWCCVGALFLSWLYHTCTVPSVILLPLWDDQYLSFTPVCAFFLLSFVTGFCLFRSTFADPGRIPFDSRSTSVEKMNWTHCRRCLIQRPLKSHHCSKCQRCIRKMDHHCHWVNNCIGEDNQWVFLLLVFYGSLLSLYSLILIALYFYVFPTCITCDQTAFSQHHAQFIMYGAFISGVGLLMICTSQTFVQSFNILMNRTTVESIINSKKPPLEVPSLFTDSAHSRFRTVCGSGPVWWWFNPFRRRRWKSAIHYQEEMQYI